MRWFGNTGSRAQVESPLGATGPKGTLFSSMGHTASSGYPFQRASSPPQNSANAWTERIQALKNIPPVLRFVWESGPAVVFWNIAFRILAAFFPVGIGIIGRFIIDGVNHIRLHQPLPQNFWWLVGRKWFWQC